MSRYVGVGRGWEGERYQGGRKGEGGGLKGSVSVSIFLINAVNTSAFPEFFVDFNL